MKVHWLPWLSLVSAQTCADLKSLYRGPCCGDDKTKVHVDVSGLLPLRLVNYFRWFDATMEPFYRASVDFTNKLATVLNVTQEDPVGYNFDPNVITMSPPYYHNATRPTLFPLTTYEPIGLSSTQYLDWYYDSGGAAFVDAVLDEHNVVGFPIGASAPQDYFYTMEPLNGLSDLDGLKVKGPGIFGNWLVGKGSERSDDATAVLTEYVSPAIDAQQSWFSRYQYSYTISKERRGNYFILFPKAIWNLLASEKQATVRAWAKTATNDMLADHTAHEAAYTGTLPTPLTLPGDIQQSWDAYLADVLQWDLTSSWATENYKAMIAHMLAHKNSLDVASGEPLPPSP